MTFQKKKNNKTDAAIIIGGEPATVFSAIAPVPEGLDKYLFAGIARKKGISTVKCKTVDLEVPANAEIVLEGYVDAADVRDEGPFGDHTGYYTPKEPFPTFTLTGIMQRKKSCLPDHRCRQANPRGCIHWKSQLNAPFYR